MEHSPATITHLPCVTNANNVKPFVSIILDAALAVTSTVLISLEAASLDEIRVVRIVAFWRVRPVDVVNFDDRITPLMCTLWFSAIPARSVITLCVALEESNQMIEISWWSLVGTWMCGSIDSKSPIVMYKEPVVTTTSIRRSLNRRKSSTHMPKGPSVRTRYAWVPFSLVHGPFTTFPHKVIRFVSESPKMIRKT